VPELPAPPDGHAQLCRQVLAHLQRTVRALSDEVVDLGTGWQALTPSLSGVWTLNQLRVTADALPEAIVATAEELQRGLPYRHIVTEHPATARRLEDTLGPAGWREDREVLMVLTDPPEREAATRAVARLDEAQAQALMRQWALEEMKAVTGADLDQLAEYYRREGLMWDERVFGILGPRGPAAITKLRRDGRTAWVEDVYTVPDQRGKGFGRALVSHCAGLARAEGYALTFIVADDFDWPKHLYAQAGFRPVGYYWSFHRSLPR
jgi:GNAT superfamily N-acetyltransferase